MYPPVKAFIAAMLVTGSSATFAAASVELTVKGFITPSACTPSRRLD